MPQVLAAVYGPHEASNRSAAASGAIVQCDYAMAPFSTGQAVLNFRSAEWHLVQSHICMLDNRSG